MDYKTFCEEQDISYSLRVFVNDIEVFTTLTADFEGLESEQHKAIKAISNELESQYYEKAEATVEEYEGLR